MTPLERLLARLPDAKPSGEGYSARCPAHDDRRASLSVGEGDDGRALVKCHAGCKVDAICAALGLRVVDLMPSENTVPTSSYPKGKPRIVAEYDYRDEAGNLVFQVLRYEPKGFRQRRPDGNGGWNWSVKDVRIIPYGLPELMADPTRPVFVVEGEKDCNALAEIGMLATCNAGGAGKWTTEHAAVLAGRTVIILPDNDDAGRNHAQQVAAALFGIVKSVRIVELPNLPVKGDASVWIAAGGTNDELTSLVATAPEWTPAAQQWPTINSFDVLDLPEFPTDALPASIRQWVEAESHATQTPRDLAALLALAVCSAGIARRVNVEVRPGWQEPVNLYVTVLLEPGNRKSAVFADATEPLGELEDELIEAAQPTVAREQSDRRQDEHRLQRLEKLAAEKGDALARHEAGILAAQLAERPEPVFPRLIVNDATSEKIAMMLEEQGGRIGSMSPEGGVFDLMAGLYSKNAIPQFNVYLMGHSGDDFNTDRVSRKGVRVKRPAITCAYAVQPVVIEGLAKNPIFRGRGLLARFLYAAPQSWIGRRQIATTPVSDAIREAYRQAVRAMAKTEGEYLLTLTVAAGALLQDWEAEIEAMLADGGKLEIMRDWGAKLAGATIRLAAVLHCIEHGPTGCIEDGTIAAAIAIARYLIPHAEAVLTMMHAHDDEADGDARYLLKWIERHGRREFNKRDVHQHGKRRFPRADDIDPALAELERRGYIRLRPTEATGPGRPPSPTYEVNPAVFASEPLNERSRNSHISAEAADEDDSGNTGNAFELAETSNRVLVTI